jgi:antitoxin (DNA-binding transcriptional repressor) of toxin-antitoxin stability system
MKEKTISVTEAARNFADCINRAHYQDTTFILLKNGTPFARITPPDKKSSTGKDIAEALAKVSLTPSEARAWQRDLKKARKALIPPVDKWQ